MLSESFSIVIFSYSHHLVAVGRSLECAVASWFIKSAGLKVIDGCVGFHLMLAMRRINLHRKDDRKQCQEATDGFYNRLHSVEE